MSGRADFRIAKVEGDGDDQSGPARLRVRFEAVYPQTAKTQVRCVDGY